MSETTTQTTWIKCCKCGNYIAEIPVEWNAPYAQHFCAGCAKKYFPPPKPWDIRR